ncbi:MAG: DUF2971 domain-containing protein [Pseudomonadota bacterium]
MPENHFKYKPIYIDQNGRLEEQSILHIIEPIRDSSYYLPTRKQLNDPTEGTFDNQVQEGLAGFMHSLTGIGEQQEIKQAVLELMRQISHSTDNSGVFSLSKTAVDELMWGHYANSHCGIAIEYDIVLLTRFSSKQHLHCFDVRYSETPPELKLENIQENIPEAICTMLGHKSSTWSHESEFRVLLENTNGPIPHDYRAVKSITFGLGVSEAVRRYIYEKTKHKVQNYFEIAMMHNSYDFERKALSEFLGNTPKGIHREIEWDNHLLGVSPDRKSEFIKIISDALEKDPHFKELYLTEISTVDTSQIVVSYEAQHEIPLQPWSKYTKYFYPM